jgi:hypothetical protein
LKEVSQADPSAGTGSGHEKIGDIILSLEVVMSVATDNPITC